MLKFQMGLIALLIACVAFISCDQLAEILISAPPEEDTTPDSIMNMMGLPTYISMYTSWQTNVTYPEPVGTGGVHGEGARTVYINDVGTMALEDENMTAYPAGTIIVKEIMDDANTFIQKVATMKKTDDSRHNGWTYKKYARPDENADYMQVRGDGLEDAAVGCHGCHAAAPVDSVFVDFSMDSQTTEPVDGTMPDEGMMTDEGTMTGYTSWMSVTYGAISPAHPGGDRVVYINDVGAMALEDESMTAFPVGTIVIKEIMDATNTSVEVVERMEKTDDPMYATEDGWLYNKGGSQAGCHGCHVGADMDSVFTDFDDMADHTHDHTDHVDDDTDHVDDDTDHVDDDTDHVDDDTDHVDDHTDHVDDHTEDMAGEEQ